MKVKGFAHLLQTNVSLLFFPDKPGPGMVRPAKKAFSPPLHRDGSVFVRVPNTTPPDRIECEAYLGSGEYRADALYMEEERRIVSGCDSKGEQPSFAWIRAEASDEEIKEMCSKCRLDLLFLEITDPVLQKGRYFFHRFRKLCPNVPVIVTAEYAGSEEKIVMHVGAEIGGLLVDGMGDGILLRTALSPERNRAISFSLLQACRMRASRTELIACPGCGRTLFDLQETTKRIRKKTAGFPGLKIGIMGCVVNGPGEMADADVGYVGSRPGQVDLYVGKTCVERGVDVSDADQKLLDLIRKHVDQ